ncbi:HAD-IIB family hydrolase [Neorhizobium sp. NPDC001467]|uniref:HAD-IIB family hydrolase n=1 Tax=Neorhizobium sp. NPDC001467 TaxID=3390595 RepID=UPI003CFD0445
MFVLHVALQGCLRGNNVEYGVTADTGGHIRYLMDLVNACEAEETATKIVIATRAFQGYGADYERPFERVSDKISIVRFRTNTADYVTKEDMHAQVETFSAALIDYLRENGLPDVVHAHYADAATVAARVKQELGIPFLFTGHSLGRVKIAAMPDIAGDASMTHRLAAEECALEHASLVIASSRDEAELQYKSYRNYDAGKIRVLPPGSDLAAFQNACANETVDAELGRFLADPQKPVLLAIARPVTKKNLVGLVRAYGKSKALQEAANLVIIAGNRNEIDELEPDLACNLREILHLVDTFDLYGKVAYPKMHHPCDVPAYYAFARDRGGIFVNPALNEPFGLTLLEASAVGLPLIATDSGGPNDIVETCGNGVLIGPRDEDALAAAALKILGCSETWQRYASAGERAITCYDWVRHATRYHGLVRELVDRTQAATIDPAQLLISDIDNTLVGSVPHLHAFGNWRRQQSGLSFGVATGRSFHSAMAILEQQDVPRPEVMITSVGSEIYHLSRNGVSYEYDREWAERIAANWDRAAIEKVLRKVGFLSPQAPLEQRDFKLSYFSDGSPGVVPRLTDLLEKSGLRASVIHSHRRYLDILPLQASKGTAVDYVRRRFGLPENMVFVAGDSGNDIEMLQAIPQSIIVANYSDGLASLPALRHSYIATETHAAGIIEGVLHFRKQAEVACPSAS